MIFAAPSDSTVGADNAALIIVSVPPATDTVAPPIDGKIPGRAAGSAGPAAVSKLFNSSQLVVPSFFALDDNINADHP